MSRRKIIDALKINLFHSIYLRAIQPTRDLYTEKKDEDISTLEMFGAHTEKSSVSGS